MSMGFLHPSEPLEPSEACPPAGDRRKDRQREADRRLQQAGAHRLDPEIGAGPGAAAEQH